MKRFLALFRITTPHAKKRCVSGSEQGDVPGWVLITLMTAALVVAIWGVAQAQLIGVFEDAIAKINGI